MRRWVRAAATSVAAVLVAAATTSMTAAGTASEAARPVSAPLTAGSSPAPARPNIVFVLTDDMRDGDLAHMPITRRLLVEQGLEFTDAISPHPLCCPARASLVTGQYAQNNGVRHNRGPHGGFAALDPTQEASLWFRRAGYRTGFVGKFLNGYGPHDVQPAGWTSWDALTKRVYDYHDFTMSNDGQPESFTDALLTDVIAERTEALTRRFARTGDPFVIYSWHLAPHYRIGPEGREPPPAAPRDRGLFRGESPPAASHRVLDRRRVADQPRYFRGRRPWSGRHLEREHRARLRALQPVDRAVGTLVRTLEEEGVLDDTYVVFASDNGFLLGEHEFVGKNVLSEPALQVPLVIRGPGVPRGVKSDLPATLVDLPATFAALAGLAPAWTVDGASLAPTLRGEPQLFRDTTLVQTGSDGGDGWAFRGVRTDRYLFATGSGEGVLYDRSVDPDETTNFYTDPAYARVRAALEQRRAALVDCHGWSCHRSFGALPEPALDTTPFGTSS